MLNILSHEQDGPSQRFFNSSGNLQSPLQSASTYKVSRKPLLAVVRIYGTFAMEQSITELPSRVRDILHQILLLHVGSLCYERFHFVVVDQRRPTFSRQRITASSNLKAKSQ